jgi:hypothetical protein
MSDLQAIVDRAETEALRDEFTSRDSRPPPGPPPMASHISPTRPFRAR